MLSFEVMLAHMFTQMLIVVVQDALLLIFALIVFQVSRHKQPIFEISNVVTLKSTVLSLYNTPLYITNLDITLSCCGSQNFFHGISQRYYRKNDHFHGHFPIISF